MNETFKKLLTKKENMIQLENSWLEALKEEFKKPYMEEIKQFLEKEILAGKTIYPHPKNIFNALNSCPLENVKVVILGQDPYHGPHQAHGLSFSVQDGIIPPPSLKNIYKEIESDLGIKKDFSNGNLSKWAQQGVLLLNACLTVEQGKAASHSKIGWQTFTDEIIKQISDKREHIVFLLWGAYAQSKKSLINNSQHYVLETVHPSPLSAHRGFLGCRHFSQTNTYLQEHNKEPISW